MAYDERIENLRFAIVRQAITDYDKSLKFLRNQTSIHSQKNEDFIKYRKLKRDCESFFRSKWFTTICDLDPEELMRAVRQKYYNRPLRWGKEDK